MEQAAEGGIEKYQITRELGRGATSIVYLAHDTFNDRDVAIKVRLPETARDAANRERFLRESRAVAQIDHPHVVPIHDVPGSSPPSARASSTSSRPWCRSSSRSWPASRPSAPTA